MVLPPFCSVVARSPSGEYRGLAEIRDEQRATAGLGQCGEHPQMRERQELAQRAEQLVTIADHLEQSELKLREQARRRHDVEWSG